MAEAIDEFTSQFPKESEKWREHLEKLETKMKLDGEDLLANSLRTYTDLTIGTAGSQIREIASKWVE